MRVREIYEVYHSFRQLLQNGGDKVIVANADEQVKQTWLETFRDKVDVEEVHLTGHSFGGGTMVS
jgi:platelet-activating factor acetylhydrolase